MYEISSGSCTVLAILNEHCTSFRNFWIAVHNLYFSNVYRIIELYVDFQMHEIGHLGKLTCVKNDLGSIITSSTDGTLKILTPTQDPQTIATITSATGEVTGVSNIIM